MKEGDTYSKDNEALVHKTIKKVSDDIENMKFNTAIAALMTHQPVLRQGREPGGVPDPAAPPVSLRPPHCGGTVGAVRLEGMACTSSWPAYDESKTIASEVTIAVQVGGKLKPPSPSP